MSFAVPASLLTRFRALSNERLAKIETAWVDATRGPRSPESVPVLQRELHTLKGDSRVIGFGEIAQLCELLEELVGRARERDFHVHDEVDIVVTMALQFVSVLLRKSPGAPITGIDLAGFLAHVREIIDELPPPSVGTADESTRRLRVIESRPPDMPLRARIDAVANDLFVEALRADGEAGLRLLDLFARLTRESAETEAVAVGPILEKHEASAREVAVLLEKQVAVVRDATALRLDPKVAECIDVVALHAVRNAVDHGIESPEVRLASGKPKTGTITFRIGADHADVVLEICDDGAGVDLDAVTRRAKDRGLLPEDAAPSADEVLELLFQPGFSTRDEASDISGRGIGMDAARATARALGGDVVVRSEHAHGATTRLTVPLEPDDTSVHLFERRPGLLVAVPTEWEVADCVEPATEARASDPAWRLLLAPRTGRCHTLMRGKTKVTMRLGEPRGVVRARLSSSAPDNALHRPIRTPFGYGLLFDPSRTAKRR